jgi:disulfide bond formation protein DsbB
MNRQTLDGKTAQTICEVVYRAPRSRLGYIRTALIFNYPIWLLEKKFRVLLLLFEPAVMVRRELSEVQQETYIYFLSIGPIDIVGLLIFYFFACFFIAACWTRMESIVKTRI